MMHPTREVLQIRCYARALFFMRRLGFYTPYNPACSEATIAKISRYSNATGTPLHGSTDVSTTYRWRLRPTASGPEIMRNTEKRVSCLDQPLNSSVLRFHPEFGEVVALVLSFAGHVASSWFKDYSRSYRDVRNALQPVYNPVKRY